MSTIEVFNQKIDFFSNSDQYSWLRKYADDAIIWYSMSGFYQIKADDFIRRIIAAPVKYIADWLDGKNMLEWDDIRRYIQ